MIVALLQESLAIGSQPKLQVTSNSMVPVLQSGDQVIVEAIKKNDLRIGDLLVIQRKSDLLTHRMVATHEYGYYTKGDHASILDPLISFQSILGRVTLIERGETRIDQKKGIRASINPILGRLGWWGAKIYQISPLAWLPFRLLERIIVRVFY